MGYPIPLGNIGTNVIGQITRVCDAFTTPDGQAQRLLRSAEITIQFATADGLPISPTNVVVGEIPLLPEVALQQLAVLDRKVLVAQADVSKAKTTARGTLTLRLIF